MDLTSAIGSLGGDYVNKVTSAMKGRVAEQYQLICAESTAGRDRLCSWQYD